MGLFDTKVKSKKIASEISITSPAAFRESIKKLEKNGLTTHEERALILAQNRAKAQLHRKDLSPKERSQFKKISMMHWAFD